MRSRIQIMAYQNVSIAGNPIDTNASGANEPVELDELVNKVASAFLLLLYGNALVCDRVPTEILSFLGRTQQQIDCL